MNNEPLVIRLAGRIDSNNAPAAEKQIQSQLQGGETAVTLDMAELEYISSAGLRVILHLRKTCPALRIVNVSPEVYEILDMTGFTEMMPVEKAYRRVSVEGCEVVGEGFNGKVYRIDQDNVVKVYKRADALAQIRHEREVARLALILGVPTAISYDVVRVGDSYGSVFELLDARSFAKILAQEPERLDWCVTQTVELLKKVHGITVPKGKLPSIKEEFLAGVRRLQDYLPAPQWEKLERMVRQIPDSDRMTHGDYHTKNIVVAGGEVLLIDMDTLSVGHPIFELAQMFSSYVGFSESNHQIIRDFQGYDQATADVFWAKILSAYLGPENASRLESIQDKIRVLSYADLIDWKRRHSDLTSPEDREMLDLWTRELTQLLERVDSLAFELEPETGADPA